MPFVRDTPYAPLAEDDLPRFIAILRQAFHGKSEHYERSLRQTGLDAYRIARREGEVAGGLALLRAGQWFGGRPVPCACIASVAVAPEHRGGGIASGLLRGMLDEARAEGMPISALYPSTLTVYRKAGYEIAGVRHIYRQEFDFAPPRPDAPVKIRAAGPADAAAIRSFYAERARGADGNLDRSDLLWDRLLLGRGAEPPLAFLACDANGLAGYAVYPQPEEWGKPVAVQDIWLASRDAARAFMGFFVNLRSTVSGFAWRGGPEDPLAHWLPELNERGIRREIWMTRIVDAAAALEARGWPEDARGELGLEIEDGWFPWNRGRFTLEVADGQARVRPGGSGEARLDIRRLAQLYTGHLSPQSLAAMGELQIGRPALAFASRVFAGPKPWMMDGF